MSASDMLPLKAKRLILRSFEPGDLEPFYQYRADPAVAKYQSWACYTREDAKAFLDSLKDAQPNVPGTWYQYAIQLDSGEMIGDCAVRTDDDIRQAEIGITMDTAHQGRGYATEAMACLLDFLFHKLDKHRVIAITDVLNTGSVKLMERLGFRREAHFVQNVWFKGSWGDEYQYAMLGVEWEARS